MGMRQNVKLSYQEGAPVYIYSHWDGGEDRNESPLADKVRTALSREQRWDDESYLARIIVSEIIRDHLDSETGYGIAPYECDPEFPTIDVDLAKCTVNGIAFDKFISHH
jgi:hypothetical protein